MCLLLTYIRCLLNVLKADLVTDNRSVKFVVEISLISVLVQSN